MRTFIAPAMALMLLTSTALLSNTALAADPVKIGFLSTFSGPSGQLGQELFDGFNLALEQNGRTVPLFTLDDKNQPAAIVTQTGRNQLRISRAMGKQSLPDLRSGAARIVVTATRPSFLNLLQLTATASKDVQVRLELPRISVVSTHHYVNHGGSEMVVYTATPPDVMSGVRVGDVEYLGFPAPVAGVGPSVKVAFFALLHDLAEAADAAPTRNEGDRPRRRDGGDED